MKTRRQQRQSIDSNAGSSSIPLINYNEPLIKIEIPMVKYEYGPLDIIPLNNARCNNGNFQSVDEAMLFIMKHCQFHHGNIKRYVVFRYLVFANVPDFDNGGMVPLCDLNTNIVSASYNRIARRLRS